MSSAGGGPVRVQRPLWVMLLTLLLAFALSQAFRTVTTIMAQDLQSDFGLTASSLGAFAALFSLSFGIAQLLMGSALDVYGLRRTVLVVFVLAICGALVSALAPGYAWLVAGQLLIGVGCAPALLSCTLFISRHYPSDRFAFYSGVCLGLGGLGLIFTGTPLAWVVQSWGWRAGFGVLALLAALAWLLIYVVVHEPLRDDADQGAPTTLLGAFSGFLGLFALPHTWGIVALSMSSYAAFLSLRGLWLGPLLIDRFHFSLIDSGNVALVLSVVSLFAPALFGRLDPGPQARRRVIVRTALAVGLSFALLAWMPSAAGAVALILLIGLGVGLSSLQYSDVRSSYPARLTARALSLYTMVLFLGAALMQWFTGVVAGWAPLLGVEPFTAVFGTMALWLALAAWAFRTLPASALLRASGG